MAQSFDRNAAQTWAADPDYQFATVAAGVTDQALGAGGGAIGDYLKGILIIPGTTSPGGVSIEHASTNIVLFVGGASSVPGLAPIWVPLGIRSTLGGWEVTTGANVTAIAVGTFT